MTNQEEFREIYNRNVTRKGADKLLTWLEQGDFFTAPASTRYHLAEDGGLCAHSLHVYKRLSALIQTEGLEISEESAALCGTDGLTMATMPGSAAWIGGGSYYVLDAAQVADLVNEKLNPYQKEVTVVDLAIRAG